MFIGIIGVFLIPIDCFMLVSTLLRISYSFVLVSTFMHISYWIRFPSDLLLIWSGVVAARAGGEEVEELQGTCVVRNLIWLMGGRLLDNLLATGVLGNDISDF